MDEAVRDRLAVALDLDDLVAASRLARSLVGHFRVAKIGLELYTAAGPEAIGAMIDLGYDVFCDLKLHDIPTTVARAARVVGELGVSYLTIHAAGGTEMLQAGAEGLAEGATRAAGVLAVTVLTSDAAVAATRDLVAERMGVGVRGRLRGRGVRRARSDRHPSHPSGTDPGCSGHPARWRLGGRPAARGVAGSGLGRRRGPAGRGQARHKGHRSHSGR